jgi:hypothetical protein
MANATAPEAPRRAPGECDFAPALTDVVGHHAVETERGKQQRQAAEESAQHGQQPFAAHGRIDAIRDRCSVRTVSDRSPRWCGRWLGRASSGRPRRRHGQARTGPGGLQRQWQVDRRRWAVFENSYRRRSRRRRSSNGGAPLGSSRARANGLADGAAPGKEPSLERVVHDHNLRPARRASSAVSPRPDCTRMPYVWNHSGPTALTYDAREDSGSDRPAGWP